ncbi:MAG: transcriptional repressor [Deltaproteobacteria bacterium]|nr:transcriptional repressor [Deltaproteobacteria bacterium]
MKINKREIERRIGRFNEVCRNSGVKLTHQRVEIFREVAQTGDHPEAERVYNGVRERMPTISLDTVYRTLWLLRDLGLINTLGPPRERTRFDANLSYHHHFVCIRCGLTRDFYSDELDELKLPESVKDFGYVETTQVEVKGVCLKCAVRGKKTKPTISRKKEVKSWARN